MTHHAAFETLGEAALGAIALYRFRRFERYLGSRKFVCFAAMAAGTTTALLVAGARLLPRRDEGAAFLPARGAGAGPRGPRGRRGDARRRRRSGPYGLVFGLFGLFHRMVPVTRPRCFSVAGIHFSDKALMRGARAGRRRGGRGARPAAPQVRARPPAPRRPGPAERVPGAPGPRLWRRLPRRRPAAPRGPAPGDRALRRAAPRRARPAAPPDARAPPQPRYDAAVADAGDDDGAGDDGAGGALAAADAPATEPRFEALEPSEAHVESLVAMGFDRDRAFAALLACNDNVERAADQLLA